MVEVENFKCLKKVSARLAPITVLIGPNGSGKSSLCQALVLLKQSLGQPKILVDGPYLSLGEFEDIVNKEAESKEISIRVEGEVSLAQAKILGLDEAVKFQYKASFSSEGLAYHETRLNVSPGLLSDQIFHKPQTPSELTKEFRGIWRRGQRIGEFARILFDKIAISLTTSNSVGEALILGGFSYPSNMEELAYNVRRSCEELVRAPRTAIERIFFVPGIRGISQPSLYLWSRLVEDFTTKEGPSEQASRLASIFGYRPEVSESVSQWIAQLAKARIRHRLVPENKISLEILTPRVIGNIVNEGLGLNQIIFPLAQLAAAQRGSTVMIEEPELHLHPKAQGELVKIFLEIVKNENKQIIMTTHSEHILFRLLVAVAKKQLKPKDLAVHYFEKPSDATASDVKELGIDEKGRLKEGLPSFFEEDLNEFREYLNALTGGPPNEV
ncbi:MAG: AAA family ATPase [Candidatus Bathyarchaeia archaeon]